MPRSIDLIVVVALGIRRILVTCNKHFVHNTVPVHSIFFTLAAVLFYGNCPNTISFHFLLLHVETSLFRFFQGRNGSPTPRNFDQPGFVEALP